METNTSLILDKISIWKNEDFNTSELEIWLKMFNDKNFRKKVKKKKFQN